MKVRVFAGWDFKAERKIGEQQVTFIAKWLHEFHAENRLEGDHVFFSFALDW